VLINHPGAALASELKAIIPPIKIFCTFLYLILPPLKFLRISRAIAGEFSGGLLKENLRFVIFALRSFRTKHLFPRNR
jgi:hypothetical protein